NQALLLEEATLLCKQSALQAKDHHLQEEIYKSHYLLGRVFAFQGNSFKAAKHYLAAIIQIERILKTLAFDLSPSFLHSAWAVYEAMVVHCLQQSQTERAFSYLERARSVALSQYLRQASSQYDKQSEQGELDAHPELQANRTMALRIQYELREWQEKYHSYSALLTNIEPSISPLVRQEIIEAEIKHCETKISELFELYHLYQTQAAIPLSVRTKKTRADKIEPVEIPQLQQELTSDQLLLAYFLQKGELIIFAVTKEQFTVYEHPGGAKQLERLLPFLYAYLQPQGWASIEHPPQEGIRGLLKKLYDLLIAPIEAFLPPPEGHITIVPYGPLHKLPFHALYNERNFLIENFQISYLPASNLFRHFSTHKDAAFAFPSTKKSVIFGFSGHGHLHRCIDEAKTLAELLQGSCFIEQEATIAELIKQAPGSPLVHIATHGHARLDAPNFSSVRLADGYLNAIDAFSLDLRNCQLVTLSGCETGLSLSGGGDEQPGLGRAFLAAGARSMVISLWPVEDETTNTLMQAFYQNLLRGESKMQALRTAQRSLLHSGSPAYSHPYFWAAFRLVGDPGPLIFKQRASQAAKSLPQK
ncbi:MAG TPA: CHAT domain-containing protein, partial [Ktedonobacteraceae bacterium]|nr:CHAT domain-containing protein [Ktedonobacteraceae bacterium]